MSPPSQADNTSDNADNTSDNADNTLTNRPKNAHVVGSLSKLYTLYIIF